MSLEQFTITDRNPNDESGGGGCLCSPNKKVASCIGPFVVFQNAEVAGDPDAGVHNSPHAVACNRCVLQAGQRLQFSDALAAGESAERSAAAPDEANVDFDDLPEDLQADLQATFPDGGLTKIGPKDRVLVPTLDVVATDGAKLSLEEVREIKTDALEGLALTPVPGLQEPGEKPGELVSATPDEVDEPQPEPSTSDESGPELEL